MSMDKVPSIPDVAFSFGIFVYGRSFLCIAQELGVPVDAIVVELAQRHESSLFLFDAGIVQVEGKAAFEDFEDRIGHAVRQHAFDIAAAAGPLYDRTRLGGAVLDGRPLVPSGKRFFFHAWGRAFERPDTEAVQIRVLDVQESETEGPVRAALVLEYFHDAPLAHCSTVAHVISQCIDAGRSQPGIGKLHWAEDVAMAYKKAFQFAVRFEKPNAKTLVSLLVSRLLDLHAEDLALRSIHFVFDSYGIEGFTQALRKRYKGAQEVRIG